MTQRRRIVKKPDLASALLIAGVLLTASCGAAPRGDASPAAGEESPSTPSTSAGQSPISQPTTKPFPALTARCSSIQFDSNTPDLSAFEPFNEDIGELMGDDPEVREEYELSLEWWESLNWSVVERSDTSLLLFGQSREAPSEVPSFGRAEFAFTDGRWRPVGWGRCGIVIRPDGFGVAIFTLDPKNAPDPAESTLHILATERACASGQAPVDRQVLPVVVETEETVEITVLVEPVSGAVTCQGNPDFPLTVKLAQPLGGRVIRDTAYYPASDQPWPIPLRDSHLKLLTAGDPPEPGTANVVAWNGEHEGALLFNSDGWSGEPTWFQSFEGEPPTMISGFVTTCDSAIGCAEECEGSGAPDPNENVQGDADNPELPDCAALVHLGPECSQAYAPIAAADTAITVYFSGTSCRIETTTSAIG